MCWGSFAGFPPRFIGCGALTQSHTMTCQNAETRSRRARHHCDKAVVNVETIVNDEAEDKVCRCLALVVAVGIPRGQPLLRLKKLLSFENWAENVPKT